MQLQLEAQQQQQQIPQLPQQQLQLLQSHNKSQVNWPKQQYKQQQAQQFNLL